MLFSLFSFFVLFTLFYFVVFIFVDFNVFQKQFSFVYKPEFLEFEVHEEQYTFPKEQVLDNEFLVPQESILEKKHVHSRTESVQPNLKKQF